MRNVRSGLLAVIMVCASGVAVADVDVVLQTELGAITVRVYDDRAPVSAGSFLAYVDQGLYDGAGFYRTVSPGNDNGSPVISVIQGGLLSEDGALPPVEHETTDDTGILHTDGVISLARGMPGTGGGAAFFICIGDQPSLDYGGTRNPDEQGFAAFGKVVSGMDVVHAIHQSEANGPSDDPYMDGQVLTKPVLIESARRVEP